MEIAGNTNSLGIKSICQEFPELSKRLVIFYHGGGRSSVHGNNIPKTPWRLLWFSNNVEEAEVRKFVECLV